ncbi:hypothetical protein Dimus_017741 [Dionaea muscipula]
MLSLSSPSLLHSTLPYTTATSSASTVTAAATEIPISSLDKVVKTQWKAAIDFKWIRDNREAVAANIRNRKSAANLDLVLDLYDKMLTLQKKAGS